ncbi:MAG: penicillin-binding protein 2, partial [Pseudomonadota bacterium]
MSRLGFSRRDAVCLADVNHLAVSEGRIRIRISLVIFLAMICVVLIRLADVALLSPDAHLRERPAAILDTRADITDRNGLILATTLSSYSLYAEPSRIWNPEETAQALVSIRPDLDVGRVTQKLASDRAFVWIDRGLSPRERQAVFDLGHPGLGFRTEPKRVYPKAPLASHLIGWTDIDLAGAAGVERAFDDRLRTENAPELALSVDARVQHAVTEELKRSIAHFSALSGVAIVMDIQTGELIAFVSAPDFDSNLFGAASPEQRFNHASMSTYDL